MADTEKLLLGLAAAVGTALIAYARRHGVSPEPEPLDPWPLDEGTAGRAELEKQKWQGLSESSAAAAPLLATYWRAVGLPPQPPETAWSAAFISYVAGPSLAPSANHIGYARAAWKARQQGLPGTYWALHPNEAGQLRRGDIVLRGRGQPVTWQDVINDTGHKDSHGDVVTSERGGVTMLIGGNVSDSVRETSFSQLPQSVFAVLRKVGPVGVV